MLTAKQKSYNKLIQRVDKAEEFFKTATEEETEKHYPAFLRLIDTINKAIPELEKELGREMNSDETTGGFKE